MSLRKVLKLTIAGSLNVSTIIEHGLQTNSPQLKSYWRQARRLISQWEKEMVWIQSSAELSTHQQTSLQITEKSSLPETLNWILVGDVIFRFWTALFQHIEQCQLMSQPGNCCGRIVEDVFEKHQYLCREVYRLLLKGQLLAEYELESLNRFRLQCERWSDLLLGPLISNCNLDEFAFDLHRAREFGADSIHDLKPDSNSLAVSFLEAGFENVLQSRFSEKKYAPLLQGIAPIIAAGLPRRIDLLLSCRIEDRATGDQQWRTPSAFILAQELYSEFVIEFRLRSTHFRNCRAVST